MNNLDSHTKKEINKMVVIAIIIFSTLIFCTYKFEAYVEMAIVFICGVVLLLYVTNKKVQDLLHSYRWL